MPSHAFAAPSPGGATVPVVVPAGPPAPVVGATVTADRLGDLYPGGRLDGAEFARTYSRPGQMILPWGHVDRRLPQHVADFHSWVDWPSDRAVVAALTHFLDTIPRGLLDGEALLPYLRPHDPDRYAPPGTVYDGFSVLLSYWHGGERAFMVDGGHTVREWRRRHALVYRVIRQHRNGRRVGYLPVQTCGYTEAHSGPGNPKGDFDPLTWWAGVGDFAGYNVHAVAVVGHPNTPTFRSAPGFLAVAQRLANGTGRRLFVPELGVATTGAEPSEQLGRARADWIRALLVELRAAGAAGVGWLDAVDAAGLNFRLTDLASLHAWQDAMYGRVPA